MTRDMTCRDGVRALMDYTDGALSDSRRQAIEAHVGVCARCRKFLRSYCETPRIIREATVTRMPAELARRLHRSIAALPARGGGRPFRH